MTQDLYLRPNVPTKHRIRFKTDILQAYDGTEQRIARQRFPRQAFPWVFDVDDTEVRLLREQLFNHMDETFRVPVWFEAVPLTGDALAAQAIVPGDFTNSDIQSTDTVVLVREDDTVQEVATVLTVGASSLTLTGNLTNSFFQEKACIYPLVNCRIVDGTRLSRSRIGLARWAPLLEMENLSQLDGVGATVNTFASLSVLDRQPEGGTAESYDWSLQKIDHGKLFTYLGGQNFGKITRRHKFPANTKAEWQWWKKFFDTVRGMREPFWMSTWRNDFDLDSAPTLGSTTIVFDDSPSFNQWHAAATGMRALHIQYDDGTQSYHRVSTVTPGPGIETLTLTDALPADTGQTITTISMLEQVRLGTDNVDVTHWSTTQASVTLSVTSIEG